MEILPEKKVIFEREDEFSFQYESLNCLRDIQVEMPRKKKGPSILGEMSELNIQQFGGRDTRYI